MLASGIRPLRGRWLRVRWIGATSRTVFPLPDREVVMRCLAPTSCVPLAPTRCPSLVATACGDCPTDERPPRPCGEVTASGGEGTTRTRHALGSVAGLVQITYDMFTIPDRLDCFYQGVLVASTGGLVSGAGTLQWTYAPQAGDPSWCVVVVSAPTSGTAWTYTVQCPE